MAPTKERKTMVKPGKDNLLVPMGRGQEITIDEATAGMKSGSRSGYLGTGENLLKKPGYVATENLSEMEKIQKKLLRDLLIKVIEPNSLGNRSTPAMDRRSLVNKINRLLLDEILKMVPEDYRSMKNEDLQKFASNPDLLSEGDKAQIQLLYMDISP